MMMTFITQGGEGRGKTKERKATKSKGRGLKEGASRALMRRVGEVDGFLIEGGLYSETAMREAKSKNTVYSRHQGLSKQAS